MVDELRELVSIVTNIRLDTQTLNTKMDQTQTQMDKLDGMSIAIVKATESTKSAHMRINEGNIHFDKEITNLNLKVDTEAERIRSGQRWLIGTTISVVVLFLAALGLLWKAVGK